VAFYDRIREAYLVAGYLGFGGLALLFGDCSQITNTLQMVSSLRD
jgi:uncharacterized membrane protein YtjA (UPF0391 family)